MKRKGRRGRRQDEIFLSHASADRAFADELARTLRRHGLKVWYSRTELVAAQAWHDEIGKALMRCNWFVVILSNAALKSKWLRRELQYALWDDRYQRRIIPVLYKTCKFEKLSWSLPPLHMPDFTGHRDSGYPELLRVWGLKYRSR